ncbi:hypothetical protein FO519_002524 [Halicephalobus sp. NKZ332]|nr:hypothetical protein FO519_002524 [Halicephalobus sp. NKZ332]
MRIAREQQYEQFVKENEEKKLRKEQEKERERLVEETPKTPPKTVASNSTDDPYEFVAKKITGKKVVIFSKKTCPYCMKAKQALSVYRIPRDHYEIVELDDLPAGKVENIQKVLGEMTGASTVPRVFIDGNCLGGGDDTVQALTSGKLAQLLKEAGAI